MKHIQFEGPDLFARATDCFPLGARLDRKKEWLRKNTIYLGELNCAIRLMTPVKIREHSKVYFMDIITGSLYDRKKQGCLTSDYLKLMSYAKDPQKGKSALRIKEVNLSE
jgi:hypothetical protein